MTTCRLHHVTLLLLLTASLVTAFPPWMRFSEDTTETRSSQTVDEVLDALLVHDPLENRGVTLIEGRLIEGDIRRRHEQPVQFPLSPVAVAGYSKSTESQRLWSPGHVPPAHQLRNAKPFRDEIWTDRVIPFVIDNQFNLTERAQIHSAMTEIMEGAGHCITFVPRTSETDFVYITGSMGGCFSDIGRQGGNQTLSVDRAKGCVKKGIVMHELMHALGFWHEHTRYDRDSYIRILTHNIEYSHITDFNIQEGSLQNLSYDYYSILHYSTSMFSKSSALRTIELLDPTVQESEVGQRKYLSDKDRRRIRALYECPISKCSYPRTLNDESVQVVNITVGSRIVYTCTRQDHVLVGAAERTCLLDGTWSGSPPLCFSAAAAPVHCDFEEPGLCGWSQDTTDEADWTRFCSHTESTDTGPLVDHTLQNSDGYYMYLEGSHVLPNSSARLVSPLLQGGQDICVLFWYNMYGAGMGTMRVLMQMEDNRTQQLWSLSGNQNFGWKMDLIAHLNPVGPYRIVFEAIRGPLDTTDMAIDDVMVGACSDIAFYQNAVIREHKQGASP